MKSTSNYILWWQKYLWTGGKETYENGEKAYSPNNGNSWYPSKSGDRFFKTYTVNYGKISETEVIPEPIVIPSKTDNVTKNIPITITEDNLIDINTDGNIKEETNPQLKDTDTNGGSNDEILNDETEDNAINKEFDNEYFIDFISFLEISVIFASILALVVFVRKKSKKNDKKYFGDFISLLEILVIFAFIFLLVIFVRKKSKN